MSSKLSKSAKSKAAKASKPSYLSAASTQENESNTCSKNGISKIIPTKNQHQIVIASIASNPSSRDSRTSSKDIRGGKIPAVDYFLEMRWRRSKSPGRKNYINLKEEKRERRKNELKSLLILYILTSPKFPLFSKFFQ